jgi:hypothetical protein
MLHIMCRFIVVLQNVAFIFYLKDSHIMDLTMYNVNILLIFHYGSC